MNDKLIEFISDVDSSTLDDYLSNINVTSSLDIMDEVNDYDYSWLNQVEQYIPFLNKICTASYKNTDMNVLLSYENRFIKTLVLRLNDFIISEEKKYNKASNKSNSKSYRSSIMSILENEKIEIEIKVKTTQNEDLKKGDAYGMSLEERISRVRELASSLLDTSFMNLLSDSTLVHSPITKTPLFNEELNYKKCLELYNFIDNYKFVDNKNANELKENLNNKLMVCSYLDYMLLKECTKESSDNSYRIFLERLIEKIVLESSMDEKTFKKMITKKFEDEYSKKKKREANIQNTFIKSMDNYNKQVKDALRALKN